MNAPLALDPLIASALEAAFPVDAHATGNWAAPRSSTRRLPRVRAALVPALIALALCAVVLPAVAAINDWWFFGPGAPQPTGAVAEIASDTATPPAWVMNAYTSDHGICTALTETSAVARPLSAEGCDPDVQQNGLSYVFATSNDGGTEYLFGPTSPGSRSVVIGLADGSSQTVQTISNGQLSGYRFYVTTLPTGSSPTSVTALDSQAKPLGHIAVGVRKP